MESNASQKVVRHSGLDLVFAFANLEHQNNNVMAINQSKINSVYLFNGDEDDGDNNVMFLRKIVLIKIIGILERN